MELGHSAKTMDHKNKSNILHQITDHIRAEITTRC